MKPKQFVTLSIVFALLSITGIVLFNFFNTPAINKQTTNSSSIISSASSGPNGTESTTTLSTTVVAAHNNTSDCWIILENKVLDVTTYLYQHPGGASAIIPYCGADATGAFNAVRKHKNFAKNLADSFSIGNLGDMLR